MPLRRPSERNRYMAMPKFDFSGVGREEFAELAWSLTDDEKRTFILRRKGRHNAEIAAELNCSERTVNRLVRSLKTKIG